MTAQELRRSLKLPDLFSVATGSMISSGLFVLPGLAYAYAGPSAVLAYLFAGILIVPALLSKIELTTAMPKAGGDYYFLDRSLGHLAGTIAGIAAWSSISIKTAFAFVGIRIFLQALLPQIDGLLFSLIACAFFTVLNLRGVSHAGRTQVILVVGLLAILLVFSVVGSVHTSAVRMTPFFTGGIKGFLEATALVFVAFGGLTKAASVSEESSNPKRDIPLGLISALAVVTFLYFTSVLVCVGTLDGPALAASMTPLSDAGRAFAGNTGYIVLTIAAVLAFLSTANAGIMASARFPMAMSRDRLIPGIIARIGTNRGTPWVSILLTGGFIAGMMFLDFESLVKMASAMQLLLYVLSNIAVIVMRESRIHTYRPSFRTPLYPWTQIAGIVTMTVLMIMIGMKALIAFLAISLGGTLWYFIYSRSRVAKDSALLCLADRIFPKELKPRDGSIEKELKSVLMDRDVITEDRFDKLVLEAEILDIKKALGLEEFLHIASERLSEKLDMDKTELFKLLLERERTSPTALRPGLAIPHIIIPGEHKFSVTLARCRDGIDFEEGTGPVHTVFILAGTMDERNFHLKALMAIAQITTASGFDSAWEKCRTPQGLRDLVLLSKRMREG
ncbi:MAG: hypothetical protein AVO35_12040 [Candidatus Aegiribacteria sp. MLS_C]|nr:MAG: hypothetical protein AVO35_12040 [Candidatus Aegiribacteria sp. MLS_C]